MKLHDPLFSSELNNQIHLHLSQTPPTAAPPATAATQYQVRLRSPRAFRSCTTPQQKTHSPILISSFVAFVLAAPPCRRRTNWAGFILERRRQIQWEPGSTNIDLYAAYFLPRNCQLVSCVVRVPCVVSERVLGGCAELPNLDMFPGLNTSQWSVSVWVKFNMSTPSQKERIVLHKGGSLRLQLAASSSTSWKYRVPLNRPAFFCLTMLHTYLYINTHTLTSLLSIS